MSDDSKSPRPIREYISELEDYIDELEHHCGSLFVFTKRLMTQLRKHDPNSLVVDQAWDYLCRSDLSPSPLKGRDGDV